MAYRNEYDEYGYRRRNRRREPETEGFFDRVRDWFRDRINESEVRPGYYRGNRQGYPREYVGSRSYPAGRDNLRPGFNRDAGRDYSRGESPYNSRWERTRQWRRNYDPRQPYERGSYDYEPNRRFDADEQADLDYGYGQSRYYDRYDRYNRQDYGDDQNLGRRYGGDYEPGHSRYFDPHTSRYRRQGYNREYSDYDEEVGRRGAYPSAGMGADYRSRFDYEDRYDDDAEVNFGEGDIGYENEGAFYQDLDEPENYQDWVYRYGTGRRPYYGIGPQGYQRADEQIIDDVCQMLTRHGRVDASDIHIDVQDGEVTLRGTVPDREMKRLAEDAAERITGVKDVVNEIKVNQQRAQSWGQGEQSSARDWEREQSRASDWSNSAQTGLEGLEASGQMETGAASMQELGAVTQPSRSAYSIRSEMEVIGTDGRLIGRVKEVRQDDFLVNREMARDVFVPFSAVQSTGEQVMINVTADAVDRQNWEKPEIF